MVAREGPLHNATVLDFSHVLAGPYCAMLLAGLGADVLKVESPNGDQVRNWSGPGEVPIAFHNVNRNKRSIVIDLRQPDGQRVARDLAESVDIVVENFKPGTMERYGLGYENLSQRNPRLVYGSITGFGRDGPYRDRGGYDLIAQGMAGIMSVTGYPDSPPAKAGVPVADLSAGLFALTGILAAYTEVLQTGHGQRVDVALLDSAISLTLWESAQYWITGQDPIPVGSAHRFAAPYQAFETSDGFITVAANTDNQFKSLLSVLGCSNLALDIRFISNSDRVAHREDLAALLSERLIRMSRHYAIEQLSKAGVPCGPVYKMSEVFQDEHVLSRHISASVSDADGHQVPIIQSPIRMGKGSEAIGLAPGLGEHTREILKEKLGLSFDEIAALEKTGAVQYCMN